MGRRPYMVRILSTSPLEAVEPNLHRHPYTIIEPPGDRGSKSMVGHSERHTTTTSHLFMDLPSDSSFQDLPP